MDGIEKKIASCLTRLQMIRFDATAASIMKSNSQRHHARCISGPTCGRSLCALRRVICVAIIAACYALTSENCATAQDVQHAPADTSSPRATFKSFIDACNEIYRYTEKDRYMDRSSSKIRPLADMKV